MWGLDVFVFPFSGHKLIGGQEKLKMWVPAGVVEQRAERMQVVQTYQIVFFLIN